jgi:putative spermidine/putrescine transport system permease protein/spermidine/putrescine transport system permease protein
MASAVAGVGTAGNARALARDARRERLAKLALALPALALITIVMLVPVAWLFGLSFLGDDGHATLAHYRRIVAEPAYWRAFVTTFQVSALTTLICIALGYPLAYVLAALPARIAAIALVFVMLPFWTSLLVRTYAWLVLLQRNGLVNALGMKLGLWGAPLTLVNNLPGTLVGMVHIMLPFFVLPLYGAMRAIDRECLKAAASLGASPTRAFLRVFLPLSLPGLVAGALIVFVLCLGFYVTPAVLGGGKVNMVSNQIAADIEIFFDWGGASAQGVVLLVLTLAILGLSARLLPRGRGAGGGAP